VTISNDGSLACRMSDLIDRLRHNVVPDLVDRGRGVV
jgi:hypothetical protein